MIGKVQSMAARCGIKAMLPLLSTDPDVDFSRPWSRCSNVDLPAPLGPTSAVREPGSSAKLTLSITVLPSKWKQSALAVSSVLLGDVVAVTALSSFVDPAPESGCSREREL